MLRWGAGASNLGLLTSLLTQVGVRQTHDFVQTQGQWLAQNGYVETKMFDKTVVYELTRLGDEVARGLVLDPGVEAVQLADVADDELVMSSLRSR